MFDPTAVSHGLTDSIVYGPLRSRRYGMTLGINLLPPHRKRCDWNCVYCQLGYTSYHESPDDFPSPSAIAAAVMAAPDVPELDALVICGNGEPTLHPRFSEAIAAVRAARDHRVSSARIICLTNGQALWQRDVVRALRTLDETAVKLDCGTCSLLARVNLPTRPACVHHQIRGLKRLHGAVVQTCLVDGVVSNVGDEDIDAWLETVGRCMPTRVDLYTLARPTPSGRLRPAGAQTLQRIGRRVRDELELPVRVFDTEAALAL